MTKEEIYDEQIAPLLMSAFEICKANGMPFIAGVEIEPKNIAVTDSGEEPVSIPMILARWSAHCNSNFDGLMIKFLKWYGDKPHNSIFMKKLQEYWK